MGVGECAAQESDHQSGRGGADGHTDGMPARGFAHRRPPRLRLGGRDRSCVVRRGFGNAVGRRGVIDVLVRPILLRAFIVGHGSSFVVELELSATLGPGHEANLKSGGDGAILQTRFSEHRPE